MDGQIAAGSVFMCRLCNLFSHSHTQLLGHCAHLHPEQESPDDIIVTLQPLEAEPAEKLAEGPVKRKPGRPKGSTKKSKRVLQEGMTAHSLVDGFEQNKKDNKERDQLCSSLEDKSHDGVSGLECKSCHRSFSNRRQILKHICIKEDNDEEEDGSSCSGAEGEVSETVNPEGADSNLIKQNQRQGLTREKDMEIKRVPRKKQSHKSKEKSQATEIKKTVINVVLTEDKTIPGISKMVPVEDNSAEIQSAAQTQHSAVSHNAAEDVSSEAPACKDNPQSEQYSSSNSATTTTKNSKGFQEYSIKQDSHNLPHSQLKIFTCEFCNLIFKFRHSLVAHLRTHTQEKPFQCPHCDYASAIKANLTVHLRKHTGEKFSCQQCPFSCLSPGHLKVHIERVHLKVKQHCSFCEKKYSDVKNLLKHMETRHNLKDPAVQQSYQQLRLKTQQGRRQLLYHCPTCNRHFKNQLERERHLLVHGPKRPFACLLCDHAATKMAALAAHVMKHLFMYVCCVCDDKFVSSQRLKSHLESHPELDQDQAFTDSINCSYHLIQEEGATCGGVDIETGAREADGVAQECQEDGEKDDSEERSTGGEKVNEGMEMGESESHKVQETEGATGKEQLENDEDLKRSQTRRNETTSNEEAGSSTFTPESTGSRAEDTHTSSTAESAHTPALENRTPETTDTPVEHTLVMRNPDTNQSDLSACSEKELEVVHPSAFQQVFSSLQKTQLNIETFHRLRKIYGNLECQYCGKLFWYKVHYNVHVRTHTKEYSHYCSKCSYSSITKSALKRHQVQKHSGVLLPCSYPECKYTTPDKCKLQAHQRTQHEKTRSASCPVCRKSYPNHRLKYHIKSSHPDTFPAQGKNLMVQRAEKCPHCDSYFLKNSSDFQQHIWAHQGLKPYTCSVCDYAGRSRSNLKSHMNRHNTERRHLCDLCGKKFKSKFTLKSHRLSHTDEGKRFQCSECDYTSVYRPSLHRHMEQHAEFKPFRCAHCHYSCNVAGALKRHHNMKHSNQKYENAGPGLPDSDELKQQGGMKCPECDFVYGTKWELNRHLKSKHCMKVVEGPWEVEEEVEAQYVSVEDEEQLTEAPLAELKDTVNIQQVTEFSSETQEAVTSMVAMAPGTVTVVQQLQEVDNCSSQLMVLEANGGLDGDQVMVVEEGGLEALTVLTQGDDAHHYIVYVQEHTVEIN
ncbi:zinc finger protein ZFAT [Salarias fasciatus]|uniref:C2H2-type domain-containing protein n=1 Tax=Salarias fasciatus TaxID=181472 RepID=A0A672GAG7_SALFA|nr:zinc finger protein ZFAT [Salarias fasciatus]